MASIERTAYPRFKRSPTPQHLHALYTPADAELIFAQKTARSPTSQLGLLVLLKSFQQLGYFPKISDVPVAIVNHLRNCLSLIPAIEPGYEETRTLYRHHQAIRDYLRVTPWGTGASRLAIKAVSEAAETKDNPADLINVALEMLIKERYELPAFSTLDRLVRRVRTVVNQRYFEDIFNRLSPEETARLDALLITEGRGSRSPYQRLKHLPKSPTLTHLQDWITQFEWLESHGKIDHLLAGLPPLKLKHFAAEAWALDAAEMKDFAPSKRYTLLLCLIHRTRVQCRDQLALMLIKRMSKIQQRGKDELEALRLQYREKTAGLVSLLAEVVTASENSASDEQAGQSVRKLLAERGPADQLLEECEKVVAYSSDNYQSLLWRYYRNDRGSLFRLVKNLCLSSTSQDQSVINALNYLLENENRRGDWLPDEVDLSFASERWLRTIYGMHKGELMLNRRHFEVCVFIYLAAELKTGDISIAESDEYADYREQLLPWEDCETSVADYCRQLDLPSTAEDFVAQLKQWLTETAQQVDEGYPKNGYLVIDEQGQPRLKKWLFGNGRKMPQYIAVIESRPPPESPKWIFRSNDYSTCPSYGS